MNSYDDADRLEDLLHSMQESLGDNGHPAFREWAKDWFIAAHSSLAFLRNRLHDLEGWAQQVHDAIDGRPLPEHPDEAPARIARLRDNSIAALIDDLEKT